MMNEQKREQLIVWLENIPWWDELPYANLEAENEMLLDALAHCGYDPEDCIDCGGPPHNEYCRFWKLRHILPELTTQASDNRSFCSEPE